MYVCVYVADKMIFKTQEGVFITSFLCLSPFCLSLLPPPPRLTHIRATSQIEDFASWGGGAMDFTVCKNAFFQCPPHPGELLRT